MTVQRDKDFMHVRSCQKDIDSLVQSITENKFYITEINKKAQVFNEDVSRTIQEMNTRVNETHLEIQSVVNETSNKLSELFKMISDIRKDKNTIENIANDYAKLLDNFKSQMYLIIQNKINDSFGSSKDIKKRLDMIVEETEELWQFNQRFIDEHAIDRERLMTAPDLPTVRKMEILEWFSRYCEFLTPDHAFNVILSFKNMYLKGLSKETFINLEHDNDSIVMMIDLIDRSNIECRNCTDDVILKKLELRMSTRLNLIEPMLVNYQNLDLAISRNFVDLLMDIIKNQVVDENDPEPEFKIYLKYALRCLALCLRTKTGLDAFLSSKITFNRILDFISIYEDEEIVANSCKIVKMILNESEKVVMEYKLYNIAKLLAFSISKFMDKSEVITLELLGSLERYTMNPDHIGDYPKDMIEIVLLAAKKKWKQNPAKQVIRNLAQNPEYENMIRQYRYVESDSD